MKIRRGMLAFSRQYLWYGWEVDRQLALTMQAKKGIYIWMKPDDERNQNQVVKNYQYILILTN